LVVLIDRLFCLAHSTRSGIYKDYHAGCASVRSERAPTIASVWLPRKDGDIAVELDALPVQVSRERLVEDVVARLEGVQQVRAVEQRERELLRTLLSQAT
jgi:hypothetical protein